MKFEITNCQECPFANRGNEYGIDTCNLSDFIENRTGNKSNIIIELWHELPNNHIHDNCPIKRGNVNIYGGKDLQIVIQ